MLPTDRLSQLRKVELRSEEGVGGYHSLVEGSLQGGDVQTGKGQNCSVGSNIPPVVVLHQDQQMTFARPGWFTEGGSGLGKHEGSPDKRWQTGGQVFSEMYSCNLFSGIFVTAKRQLLLFVRIS